MGLFDKFKKKEPVYVDSRIIEKMKESDLPEYLEEQRRSGKNIDLFGGKKIPKLEDNPLLFFLLQLSGLISTISSRTSFEKCGFTESEINAIMKDKDMIIGISHPDRCVKDLVWWYMIQNEFARLSKGNGDKKSGEEIDAILKNRKEQEDWLDWELALDEFWKDESEKDYRSYIITK